MSGFSFCLVYNFQRKKKHSDNFVSRNVTDDGSIDSIDDSIDLNGSMLLMIKLMTNDIHPDDVNDHHHHNGFFLSIRLEF